MDIKQKKLLSNILEKRFNSLDINYIDRYVDMDKLDQQLDIYSKLLVHRPHLKFQILKVEKVTHETDIAVYFIDNIKGLTTELVTPLSMSDGSSISHVHAHYQAKKDSYDFHYRDLPKCDERDFIVKEGEYISGFSTGFDDYDGYYSTELYYPFCAVNKGGYVIYINKTILSSDRPCKQEPSSLITKELDKFKNFLYDKNRSYIRIKDNIDYMLGEADRMAFKDEQNRKKTKSEKSILKELKNYS